MYGHKYVYISSNDKVKTKIRIKEGVAPPTALSSASLSAVSTTFAFLTTISSSVLSLFVPMGCDKSSATGGDKHVSVY